MKALFFLLSALKWGKLATTGGTMLLSLAIFLGVWWALRSFGNTGLWTALLGFYVARGALQGARYPALFRASF